MLCDISNGKGFSRLIGQYPELIITDPDPDPHIENQEFKIRILSIKLQMVKKVANSILYEHTNRLKSLTF